MTPISKIKKCYIMRIKMLVYVVWAFVLALGVQSCHQPDVLPEAVRYPILFGSSDSRAVATKDTLIKEGFRVHAYFKGQGEGAGAATFDHEVNHQVVNNQDIWALSNTEYWIPGAKYWFKAFYPKDLAVVITLNDGASQSYSINDFDIRTQKDIMVASADELTVPADGDAPISGSVVDLNFQHLLANVTIKAKSQIDGVIIQEIVIGRADTNSKYNGSVWNLSGNTTTLEYSKPTTLTKGAEFVDVTNGGILVVPASANNKTLTIQANKTYKLEFPTGTWEPGKRYTYTLEIKQDDIIFVDDAPYVEEWDSENATGSVIIK